MLRPSADRLANVARAEAAFTYAGFFSALKRPRAGKKAFDDNRERLKKERLAREALCTHRATTKATMPDRSNDLARTDRK
jgi:hypothetical protein